MTKIRPQDTLNHIFPEKGFFYALALVKYRCCILKIPGLGPAPCSAAYTCILKFPEPRLAPVRQRILVYSNFQNPGLFLLGSVYCILKFPGPGQFPR